MAITITIYLFVLIMALGLCVAAARGDRASVKRHRPRGPYGTFNGWDIDEDLEA